MARYQVGFDGKWQETFDDPDEGGGDAPMAPSGL
jgi:hypothetical protein